MKGLARRHKLVQTGDKDVGDVVGRRRLGRGAAVTEPRRVGGQHGEMRRQQGNGSIPVGPRSPAAVQKDKGRAAAFPAVPDAGAVGARRFDALSFGGEGRHVLGEGCVVHGESDRPFIRGLVFFGDVNVAALDGVGQFLISFPRFFVNVAVFAEIGDLGVGGRFALGDVGNVE